MSKPAKPKFLDCHVSLLSTVGLFLCLGVAIFVQPFSEERTEPTSTATIESTDRVPLPAPTRYAPGKKDTSFVIMDKNRVADLNEELLSTPIIIVP